MSWKEFKTWVKSWFEKEPDIWNDVLEATFVEAIQEPTGNRTIKQYLTVALHGYVPHSYDPIIQLVVDDFAYTFQSRFRYRSD